MAERSHQFKLIPERDLFPGQSKYTYRKLVKTASDLIIDSIINLKETLPTLPVGKPYYLKINKLDKIHKGLFKYLKVALIPRKTGAFVRMGQLEHYETFNLDTKEHVENIEPTLVLYVYPAWLNDETSIRELQRTIEHELIHYMDVIVKNYNKDKVKNSSYYNNPLELNAFFQEVVSIAVRHKDELIKALESKNSFEHYIIKILDQSQLPASKVNKANKDIIYNKIDALYEDLYHEYKAGRLQRLIALIIGRRYKFVAQVEASFIDKLAEG